MAGFRDYGINFKKNGSQPISADANHLALSATNDYTLHLTNASGGYAHLHVQDLYVDGVANVSAGFWNIDYANIEYTLSVSGDATFGSDVLILDDLSVWGDSYVGGNKEIDGTVVAHSTLEVDGDITGHSNLRIDLSSVVGGNSTVSGSVLIGGSSDTNGNANVDGNVTIGGTELVNGTSNIIGNLTTNSSLFVNQNATITGNTSILGNTGIVGNLSVTGASTLNGNVVANNDVAISGFAVINETLTVTGDITGTSNLNIKQDAIVEGDVSVYGNELVNGNISVSGNVYVNGLVVQGVGTSADVVLNNNLIVTDNVDICGNLNVLTNVNVEGNTEIDGTLTVHTDLVVDGNATIQGIVNFDALGTLDNDFHVGQDLYAHDDLYVEDFAEVSGALHIINYTKNNVNGLHRNENSGGVTAEPGYAPYHSILWVEGNAANNNYLATFENSDLNGGGYIRCVNDYDIDVVNIRQIIGGAGSISVFNQDGLEIINLTASTTWTTNISSGVYIWDDSVRTNEILDIWGYTNDGDYLVAINNQKQHGDFLVCRNYLGNDVVTLQQLDGGQLMLNDGVGGEVIKLAGDRSQESFILNNSVVVGDPNASNFYAYNTSTLTITAGPLGDPARSQLKFHGSASIEEDRTVGDSTFSINSSCLYNQSPWADKATGGSDPSMNLKSKIVKQNLLSRTITDSIVISNGANSDINLSDGIQSFNYGSGTLTVAGISACAVFAFTKSDPNGNATFNVLSSDYLTAATISAGWSYNNPIQLTLTNVGVDGSFDYILTFIGGLA